MFSAVKFIEWWMIIEDAAYEKPLFLFFIGVRIVFQQRKDRPEAKTASLEIADHPAALLVVGCCIIETGEAALKLLKKNLFRGDLFSGAL